MSQDSPSLPRPQQDFFCPTLKEIRKGLEDPEVERGAFPDGNRSGSQASQKETINLNLQGEGEEGEAKKQMLMGLKSPSWTAVGGGRRERKVSDGGDVLPNEAVNFTVLFCQPLRTPDSYHS